MDRDKVVKGMEQFRSDIKPFCGGKADWERFDAGLAMLKEQEAVEPKHNPLSPTDWFCGKCGMCISRFHDYCPSCGHAVKWNDNQI